MKKIFLFLTLSFAVSLLTSCSGGQFSKHQTEQQRTLPFVCDGLHMKGAQWDFIDDYGTQVHVNGRCRRGQRHGQFNFFIDNQMVAKTKFVEGNEIKTACLLGDKQMRTTLENCMDIHANARNKRR